MLHPEATEAGGYLSPAAWARVCRNTSTLLIGPPRRYHALMMHVDDVVEGIFQRLCIRQQDGHGDRSMSFDELRLALGVSEALFNEALWVLTFPGDKRIIYPTPGRVALGPDWKERCERQAI